VTAGAPQPEVAGVIAALASEWAPTYGRDVVEAVVLDSWERLAGTLAAPAARHVEAFSRERLSARAQAEGRVAPAVPQILFLTAEDAARGQMAAALLDRAASGRVGTRSAGAEPAEAVLPAAVEAMAAIGVDLSSAFPKPLTEEVQRAADLVVTIGPVPGPGAAAGGERNAWDDVPDPVGRDFRTVCEIRDVLVSHVERLLARLAA